MNDESLLQPSPYPSVETTSSTGTNCLERLKSDQKPEASDPPHAKKNKRRGRRATDAAVEDERDTLKIKLDQELHHLKTAWEVMDFERAGFAVVEAERDTLAERIEQLLPIVEEVITLAENIPVELFEHNPEMPWKRLGKKATATLADQEETP